MKAAFATLVVAVALAFQGGAAKASTLTFDLPSGTRSSYSESGFDFNTTSAVGLLSWGSGEPQSADPSSSSATLIANYAGLTVRMTAAGGVPFDFTSIDLADAYNGGVSDIVDFLFTFADSTTLASFATLDASPGLQTVLFGLSNVISAEWVITSGNFGPQFDNVVVSATPIPAALPLFMSALGGIGLFGWRRRRVPTVNHVGPPLAEAVPAFHVL